MVSVGGGEKTSAEESKREITMDEHGSLAKQGSGETFAKGYEQAANLSGSGDPMSSSTESTVLPILETNVQVDQARSSLTDQPGSLRDAQARLVAAEQALRDREAADQALRDDLAAERRDRAAAEQALRDAQERRACCTIM